MSMLQAVILGVVEGFTEFLPISSTAHLVIASKLLGVATSEFLKTFEISIQLGAIMAVVVFYYGIFLKHWETNKKILIAFLPTAAIGFIFYKIVKNIFLMNAYISIWALLVGGVFIILFEKYHKDSQARITSISNISYYQSFMIGLSQSLSIVPGVSRAAATIIGGMELVITRETMVEFSFLLAVPTMAAATGLDFVKSYHLFSGSDFLILAVGALVSFATALASISWLLKYVKKNTFIPFGIYRVGVALILLFSHII